ncbi:hypothetical protein [Streptomyces sp. TLI_146]|uniref:hypothetical protein n=1 Tax=Streptomyces sp. TLI_146 TaxID=1938858 RepID=UPI000C70DF5F|nr:hypothetical protein [Streptomyces sp. TLI_146]
MEGKQAAQADAGHAEKHTLYDKGAGIDRIAAQLGLDRKTVSRSAQAATANDMITTRRLGPHGLAGYAPYLKRRWSDGSTDSERLHRELRARLPRQRPQGAPLAGTPARE